MVSRISSQTGEASKGLLTAFRITTAITNLQIADGQRRGNKQTICVLKEINMRKLLSAFVLLFALPAAAQSLYPTQDAAITIGGGAASGGDLHVQHNVTSAGVDQSSIALIQFNLSSLPAGLNPAQVQSASLVVYAEAGG